METNWTDSLKAGDVVAVESQGDYTLVWVKKVTPTQIVVEYRLAAWGGVDGRFNRRTGNKVGTANAWHSTTLSMLTPELREKIEQKRLVLSVKAAVLGGLTSEQLKRILAIVEEGKP